jgi:hypothetical protein
MTKEVGLVVFADITIQHLLDIVTAVIEKDRFKAILPGN